MLIIGLTGGIGSGKSTVAQFFADLAIPIIDADQIAHAALALGTPEYKKVIHHFGGSILNQYGKLDRALLRNIVFQDNDAKIWLEALLHPIVKHRIQKQLKQINTNYCLVVIPLLIESHWQNLVDRILVVDSPLEMQIERTQQRDGLSRQQVLTIAITQATREQRLAIANDIIHNEGDLLSVQAQVLKLNEFYLRKCL